MTHTYTLSGMTCMGCVASVKAALESVEGVEHAEVSLTPPAAKVTMRRHIDLPTLQSAVAQKGNYSLEASDVDHSSHSNGVAKATDERSWWTTYKPILILAAVLTVSSVIIAVQSNGGWEMGMRSFMAGFFLVFAYFKLLDIRAFAMAYAGYDLLAARWMTYGYVYPFIELGLGLAYLSGIAPDVTNFATLIIMGFSSIGVIRSVSKKKEIQCACLGTVFDLPMSTVTIIEDLGMVAMAAAMLLL